MGRQCQENEEYQCDESAEYFDEANLHDRNNNDTATLRRNATHTSRKRPPPFHDNLILLDTFFLILRTTQQTFLPNIVFFPTIRHIPILHRPMLPFRSGSIHVHGTLRMGRAREKWTIPEAGLWLPGPMTALGARGALPRQPT